VTRAVFLDRDGVINRAIVRNGRPFAAESLEPARNSAGRAEALERLRASGYLNIVVTNQPDVGAGKIARPPSRRIHAHLLKELPIDA